MKTPLDNNLNKLYEAFNQNHNHLRQTLMASLPKSIKQHKRAGRISHTLAFIGDTIMKSRITKLATATVVIIAVLVGMHWIGSSVDGTSLAFGEVLENLARVQTLHARLITNGKESEVWAKRPNMLRFDYTDGKYEISNGPTIWVVDVKNNKATQKPSWYYKDAQRRGIDVLDALVSMEYTDNFSGFFSEGPTRQIKKDNKLYDVYQMKLDEYGDRIEFEALVDSETHIIHLMKVELYETTQLTQSFELSILDYDQPIPDSTFIFKPDEGMQVVVKEPEDSESVPAQIDGSTLSGRIIWASSRKPVSGARLTFWGGRRERTPEGKSKHTYFVRAETNRNGYWQITGSPAGGISMSVRSWEFEWPAMPTFTTNVGSPLHPRIVVDGQSEYSGLNFKVYKPKDLYARITIDVKDEDGHPIEGASALLQYAGDGLWSMHQHVYATPRKRQFSGPDGFDNANIWPSVRPVKLSVNPRGTDRPYPQRSISTEPFIIEPKKRYHFDIVIPYKREMTVKVVDSDHKPLEGVSVSVLSQKALPIYPLPGRNSEILFTDSHGMADVSGMFPGEEIIIALKRLDSTQPDPEKPFAFACVPATAPLEKNKPIVQVVFDERPILIEGSLGFDSEIEWARVYVMVTGEPGDTSSMIVLRTKVDENDKFLLRGVPAGKIRIAYSARIGQNNIRNEGTITTEPGNRYTVEFTEQGLQLIEQKTNP